MKKTVFRMMALALILVMALSVTGCRKTRTAYSVFLSDDVEVEGNETKSGGKTNENAEENQTTGGKNNETAGNNKTTGGKTASGSTGASTAKKDSSGRTIVKVAINSNRPTDVAPLFDALAKAYPDIKVQIDYYSAKDNVSSQEYIAAKSSTGQLPDVVFDDIANLSMYVGQGLVYPLNSYLAKDANYKYIPANIMKDYTYGGQVYALPHQAYFTCLTLNLDILDALNVDVPKLDWNFEDMVAFAKKVSNDKYCFCERLFYFDYYGAGGFSKDASLCGYNIETRSYNMVNSFAKAMKVFQQLRQTPNVEAWSLRNSKQYESRFGSSDEWAATKLGRTVVMDFSKGTYSRSYYTELLANCNWTFHPFPQEIKGRMPIHIDHAFMLANTKVPDEAFKVLSFLTYSPEGNIARLNAYTDKAKGKSKYNLNLDFYTPLTTHPDVVSAFKKLCADDEVQMYMYNNIKNCYRGDLDKFVPSWGQHWADSINPTAIKVQDGTKDPDSTCKDLQTKATKSLKSYWDDFDAKLAKVQAEWKATH